MMMGLQFDLLQLNAGMYLIELRSEQQRVVERFILNR